MIQMYFTLLRAGHIFNLIFVGPSLDSIQASIINLDFSQLHFLQWNDINQEHGVDLSG